MLASGSGLSRNDKDFERGAGLSLAAEGCGAQKSSMARNALPPSNIALAVVAAFAMLLIAIIVRNFWLSLILGVLGAATFAYAAALLREYRRSLPDRDKDAP